MPMLEAFLLPRPGCRYSGLCLLASFAVVAIVSAASPVQIDHAHKGRAYGSYHSIDRSRRIAFGADGFIYIAGTTTPRNADQDPWGDTEAGDVTGLTDVFVAKVSRYGSLMWVRRTGSKLDDDVSGLFVTHDGIYVCGMTGNDLAHRVNGSADAFILKFTVGGDWAWRRPFQFGSYGIDACLDIAVDGAVYAVGRTTDAMFGAMVPITATPKSHQFIARLEEVAEPDGVVGEELVDLRLAKGRQRTSFGSSAAIAVATTTDSVYFLTVTWSPPSSNETTHVSPSASEQNVKGKDVGDERVTTYLNIADKDAILLHRLQTVKSDDVDSFRGIDMAVLHESGEAFVVGVGSRSDGREGYYVLKFSPGEGEHASGGIVWTTHLGNRTEGLPLHTHRPCIGVDDTRKRVYVGGIEDGVFERGDDYSAILLVPVFVLDATSGAIRERWDRSTSVTHGKQEVADIAVGNDGAVAYTGVWNVGPMSLSKVLIGGLGMSSFSSRVEDGMVEGMSEEVRLQGRSGEVEEVPHHDVSNGIPIIVIFVSAAAVILLLMIAVCVRRNRGRRGIGRGDGSDGGGNDGRENVWSALLRRRERRGDLLR